MAEGRLLRQLIKAGVHAESDEFRRVAEQVIHEERAKKHHLLANDLERILYGEAGRSNARPLPRVTHDLPKDRERGLALVEVKPPVRDLGDIVVSDSVRSVLDEVLLEQGRAEVLTGFGLKPISRLLFCGPSGCGKTSSAEVLASELGLELVIVRLDTVVSSFLGETAANLRKVFDFIEPRRFVVLFDEFDAIGKEREDAGEHGELKRVVNSVLQMLDSYRGPSLLIAATNHEKLLDRAVWRRFDEVVVFDRPNLEQIRQLLAIKLRVVRHELPLDDRAFVHQFQGLTHAEIERVVIRALKSMVLKGREFVTVELIDDARRREEARQVLATRR